MPELYPLLLKPEFVERVWGARDLSPLFGQAPGEKPIGEVWLTGDACKIANGALAGLSLAELCRRFGRELVGDTAREPDRFPLLIKFLFPREKLSVQVHPDDAAAQLSGLPCGKTECWYVLQAEPGAQVALGLKRGTTREQFAKAVAEVRAEKLLNWLDIHAGEMIYVDAGTVHAIGPGSILVETQQNSDTTYRLYDYGRPRELHIEQGLAALKERTRAGKVEPCPGSNENLAGLVASPCFVIAKIRLDKPTVVGSGSHRDSRNVDILVALEGCGVVRVGPEAVTFGRGEAVVIPAAVSEYSVNGQWQLEYLRITLPPPGQIEEPQKKL